VNARSAFETIALAVLCTGLGFALCWVYVGREAATAANATLSAQVRAIEAAAPAIAEQIGELSRTANTARHLSGQLSANRQLLTRLADCPIPAELQRLSVDRAKAINAHASAGQD
jgi:hypothetical protein